MLKIFKDIMQKDKTDPEKMNLLKEKQHERKRKQYSGSRSKSDNRSISSTSERVKKNLPFKSVQEHRKAELHEDRDGSNAYKSDKKDSWWFWAGNVQEQVPPPTSKGDTCSCVSCVLKKFAGSEYACLGILIVLFVVSVTIAFWMVFRTVPCLSTSVSPKKEFMGFGDRLNRDGNILKKNYGLNGYVGNALSPIQGLKELEESVRYSDLSSIFNTDKINDIQNSEKLKNFYKKLIQTDARIRLLKKSFNDYNVVNTFDDKYKNFDRVRRSLKEVRTDERRERVDDEKKRKKRSNASDPTAFIIEKKKVLVQYKPTYSRKMVPKCSHAPKDSKSHEKQMKHPFYKNSQRLDELLDQFLDRSFPDMMSDPFGINTVFKSEKNKQPNDNLKHNKVIHFVDDTRGKSVSPKHKVTTKKKVHHDRVQDKNIDKLMRPAGSDILKDYLKEIKIKEHGPTTKPQNLDVLLSVSTIMNTHTKSIFDDIDLKYPNMRKLMQVEEDDIDIAYNDVNEVLSDDGTPHDDAEIVAERVRRADVQFPNDVPKSQMSINNPNWKTPILYPEEIKSVIKQAALSNYRVKSERNKEDGNLNDMEYLEDYLVHEDNRLSKMAQAYSDYGVLEGRKDAMRDGKNSNIEKPKELGIKLLVDPSSNERLTKASPSEGIRIEFRPSPKSHSEDGPSKIYKSIQKHLKFDKEDSGKISASPSSFLSTVPDFQELLYTPVSTDTTLNYNDFKDLFSYKTDDASENGLVFTLAKGKRTLKSISEGDEDVEDEYNDEDDDINEDMNEAQTVFIFEHITSTDHKTNNNSTNNLSVNTDEINDYYNLTKTDIINNTDSNNKNNVLEFYIQFGDEDFLPPNSNAYNTTTNFNLANLLQSLGENITRKFNSKLYDEKLENVKENSTVNNLEITDSTVDMDNFVVQRDDGSFVDYSSVDNFTCANTVTVIDDESQHTSGFDSEYSTENADAASSTDIFVMTNSTNDRVMDFIYGNNTSSMLAAITPLLYNDYLSAVNYSTNTNNINTNVSERLKFENDSIDVIMSISNRSKGAFGDAIKYSNTVTNNTLKNIYDFNITYIDKYPNVSTEDDLSKDKFITEISNLSDNNTKMESNSKFKREVAAHDEDHTADIVKTSRELNDKEIDKNKTSNFDFAEIFHVLSNIFAAFDGVLLDQTVTDHKSPVNISITNVTTEKYTDRNAVTSENVLNITSKITDVNYPIYDSEMVENIGHRSRVLMSVDDKSNMTVNEHNEKVNVTHDSRREEEDGGNTVGENSRATVTNTTTPTNKVDKAEAPSNITKLDKSKIAVTNTKEPATINKNKTVVKRNVDDSSLIFWNDIYDDEYGVKFDTMENIRDKHSTKDNNFIKSSKKWIQNKVKKISDNIKKTGNKFGKKKTTKPRTSTTSGVNTLSLPILKKNKIRKRMIKIRDDDEQEVERRDFAALTANMKEVCKKAAQAVKETRNLEVREDSRETAVATSLMGQLMKLMTDLVDYQVQQKTCLRLPPDLQNFLQWLTGNEPDGELDPNLKYYRNDDANSDRGTSSSDKSTEHDLDILSSPSSEKEEIIPERSDCLGTLKDVQDLILVYDEMSEEDKIKMAGVKEYLVNQMDFLQKLPSYSDYNTFQIHKNDYQSRFKRDINFKNKEISKIDESKKRTKLGKFIRNFGKKHTRTTANYYDSLQLTEVTGRDGKRESPLKNMERSHSSIINKEEVNKKTAQCK